MRAGLRAAVAGVVLALVTAGSAAGEGVRCAGWPGAPGVPGLIVVRPASDCVGSLFAKVPAKRTLVDVQVLRPPPEGRFSMEGLRRFSYAAPAVVSGRAMVVLDVTWQVGGRIVHRHRRLRIVSEADYYAAGGTKAGPGADMMTSRPHIRRK